MTALSKSEIYRNTTDELDKAVLGMEALTVLLVNALHFESSIVGNFADGIDILMWERVDALKSIQANFAELTPADDDSANNAVRASRESQANQIHEEIGHIQSARRAFAEHQPVDAADLATTLNVDPEVVERVISALSKPKAASTAQEKEAKRGKAAAG